MSARSALQALRDMYVCLDAVFREHERLTPAHVQHELLVTADLAISELDAEHLQELQRRMKPVSPTPSGAPQWPSCLQLSTCTRSGANATASRKPEP